MDFENNDWRCITGEGAIPILFIVITSLLSTLNQCLYECISVRSY